MYKITVQVDGMMCGMCESHINEAIRRALPVKKVKSSRRKGETEILCERAIEEADLRSAIAKTGYEVKSITTELYEKKGLFGLG